MRLAIVGSQAKAWPTDYLEEEATSAIWYAVKFLEPSEIISGRSPGGGVDQWAEYEAAMRNIMFTPFEASQNDWPHFKARNIQIGDYCDSLVCIRSRLSTTYGSGWTADYTEKLGKKVWRIDL